MKITVFTSNQPRHLALLSALSSGGHEVFAIQECTPSPASSGEKSKVMREYFRLVVAAERAVFGRDSFCPASVRQRAIPMGDLSRLELSDLEPALEADAFVVFGSSYIKGKLAQFLVDRGAYNLHMGTSPYYRGSATNFWALYDGRPQYVGATIHRLSTGLDSGPVLFHTLPPVEATDPFLLGMIAVRSAQQGLMEAIADNRLAGIAPVKQDRSRELRYSRSADFTDAVAAEYLARLPSPEAVRQFLEKRQMSDFVRPFIGK